MKHLLLSLCCCCLVACYTFTGTSIDPNAQTFTVITFDNNAQNVVPTLSQDFTNALINKIESGTRLDATPANGDVQFSGAITDYSIVPVAPKPGETTSFNRLTINVGVEYINNNNEKDTWKQTFSWFEEYPSDENLSDLQDQLIENINDQLVQDIFNKAFTNW